ncbi:MAG: M90 family metallopeptidase [Planctomycetota bacterium]
MLLRWWKNRRRNRLLATPPPPAWDGWLRDDVAFYPRLTPDDQRHLLDLARVFVAEKYFEGRDGLALTERIELAIAAQACLLLLHLPRHDYYRRVGSIFVYPDTRRTEVHNGTLGGLQSSAAIAGAASPGGPIVLCYGAVAAGAHHHNDGRNVVLHEFAHALDFNDHVADGTPELATHDQFTRWVDVMTENYDDLVHARGRSRRVIDQYGANNPAEFFACATEAFFEKPRAMQRHLPDLYDLLRDYYHQDPAERERSAA